ncbi:MAG: hypothetical protein R3C55_12070 [Parvularculaceae bacterium]
MSVLLGLCHMVRLRKLSNVHLLDAREAHPVVEELKAKEGFDLDEGMALKIGDAIYHGDECVHRLALLSGPSGLFNRFNFWVFRNEKRAKALYPALRAGRNLALRLLGKRRIERRTKPGQGLRLKPECLQQHRHRWGRGRFDGDWRLVLRNRNDDAPRVRHHRLLAVFRRKLAINRIADDRRRRWRRR